MGFCDAILQEGHINTLLGLPGSGKTNVALYVGEKALDCGFYVYTNIHFFDFDEIGEACNKGLLPKGVPYRRVPPEMVTVTKFSDLLINLLRTNKNIVILDEAGIFASSTAPMDKRVRELKELAYIIRHLRASFLLIAQSKTSMSPSLRSELVKYEMRIKKITPTYRILTIARAFPYFDDNGEEIVIFKQVGPAIGRIPLTRLPWDGFFIPKFDFDIRARDAFRELGERNSLKIRKKDDAGITFGERIVMKLRDAEKGKDEDVVRAPRHAKARAVKEEVRNLFLTMEDSGKYKSKHQIFSEISRQYNRSYQWAYGICADLPFDSSKHNPSHETED